MVKSKYESHVKPRLEEIGHWARDGLLEIEICKRIGVAESTFNKYKNDYPQLKEVLKKNKEFADYRVEDALYKRALGYEYEEVTKERVFNEKTGKYEFAETKRQIKQMAPDTTAQIFWLKNRQPRKWRDKQHIENSGTVTTQNIDVGKLSDEELEKELKKLKVDE